MDRLAAGLHDEARHAVDEIGIAVDRVFLAVQIGLAVGHRVDQPAALLAIDSGIGLPESSEIFISNSSVARTPIG